MKNEDLKDFSIDELEIKAKQTKYASSVLGGTILLLYIVTIYNSINKGEFDILMVVAIALTYTVIAGFQKAKKIEEEIKSKKS